MKKLEKIFKGLANKRRLEIIKLLKRNNLPVLDIAEALNLSFRSTSKHLQRLANAEILAMERRGRLTIYELNEGYDKFLDFLLKYIKNF